VLHILKLFLAGDDFVGRAPWPIGANLMVD
jgi:hypothetical protein